MNRVHRVHRVSCDSMDMLTVESTFEGILEEIKNAKATDSGIYVSDSKDGKAEYAIPTKEQELMEFCISYMSH